MRRRLAAWSAVLAGCVAGAVAASFVVGAVLLRV